MGYFPENDFWTPPPNPINLVQGSHMQHKDIIGHVASVPGPLAFQAAPLEAQILS